MCFFCLLDRCKGIESLPQTLIFYIFATKCRRSLIFQTINSARANNLSLKYLRFPPSGSIDIGIGKFKFVAKTQILRENFRSLR